MFSSLPPPSHTHTPTLFDNMARTSDTPKTPGRPPVSPSQLYLMWRRRRKTLGLPYPPSPSSKAWKDLCRNKQSEHRVPHHNVQSPSILPRAALELPETTEPPDYPDEDQDLTGFAASLDATQEEKFAPSFLSGYGPFDGLGESPDVDPSSTPDQISFTGPSPHDTPEFHVSTDKSYNFEPAFLMDEPFISAACKASPIAGPSSTPLSAPVPFKPLSDIYPFEDLNVFRGEEAYWFLSATGQTADSSYLNPKIASPITLPVVFGPGPSTPLPNTSSTGCDSTRSVEHPYTPEQTTFPFSVGPEDQFVINNMEPKAPDFPVWGTDPTFEYAYFPQQTSSPHFVSPPPPPIPPAAVAVGQSDDAVEAQWKQIALILESDKLPQASAPPPTYDRDALRRQDFRALQRRLVTLERTVFSFAPPDG